MSPDASFVRFRRAPYFAGRLISPLVRFRPGFTTWAHCCDFYPSNWHHRPDVIRKVAKMRPLRQPRLRLGQTSGRRRAKGPSNDRKPTRPRHHPGLQLRPEFAFDRYSHRPAIAETIPINAPVQRIADRWWRTDHPTHAGWIQEWQKRPSAVPIPLWSFVGDDGVKQPDLRDDLLVAEQIRVRHASIVLDNDAPFAKPC
jgi:hypothetical protein